MKLYVKTDEQWLYPDEELLGTKEYDGTPLELHVAAGGACGIQLLATQLTEAVQLQAEDAQINLLREVTVQYNTAQEETSGFEDAPFVYAQPQKTCPPHCTRLAPFKVYDAFTPFTGQLPVEGKQAFFLTFNTQKPGDRELSVHLRSGSASLCITVQLHVYDAQLPQDPTIALDNWFSIDNMARCHGLELYSQEHFEKLREYAKIMRAMRQTHFLLSPEIVSEGDFSILERIASIFFDEGLQTMKIGPLGQRKRVYHARLLALSKDGDPVDSEQGQEALHTFLSGLSRIAQKHGWQNKIVFHIADEPDEPESVLDVRMSQYRMMAQLVKQYFPGSKICEAVKTTKFQEYIDILVPLSKTYEQEKEQFDRALENGKEVWLYTCCVPIGNYYQRFLDVPLMGIRQLFWSIAGNRITGYLHWGLNYLEEDQHPFDQTNQNHTYGDGKCLPAGDSHILYPDGARIYRSVRMHMYRRGCEDAELLKLLHDKAPALWQELTGKQFHGQADMEKMRQASKTLLCALDKRKSL